MKYQLCHKLPDIAQHIILEFVGGYKFRLGKFIRQISLEEKEIIHQALSRRPEVEFRSFGDSSSSSIDLPGEYHYEDNEGYTHYCDENSYENYFRISFILNFYHHKFDEEETMEINYSYDDRNKFIVEKNKYIYLNPDYKVKY